MKRNLKELAMRGTHLDWNRELCRKGCKEWIPWCRNKKGEIVNGCRLGLIPQKVNGQWYCQHRKATKQKGDKAHA